MFWFVGFVSESSLTKKNNLFLIKTTFKNTGLEINSTPLVCFINVKTYCFVCENYILNFKNMFLI